MTDGGIETRLIFHEGIDLPEFAAFDLLDRTRRATELRALLRAVPRDRAAAAAPASCSRARPGGRARDWERKLGYRAEKLDALNRQAIGLMEELRDGTSRRERRW